jgi:hypothetical protein
MHLVKVLQRGSPYGTSGVSFFWRERIPTAGVDAFGFQINDLVFLNWAARFVENQVEEGCFDGRYPGFDVRWEYRKFMRVLWLLEKFAEKYALLLKCEIPGGGSKEKGNLYFHGLPKAHLDRINRWELKSSAR